MNKLEIFKKKLIYRSNYRGSKEMDLLLGSFAKQNINNLNDSELKDLNDLLHFNDDILSKWYFEKNNKKFIPTNKVSLLFKKFKF